MQTLLCKRAAVALFCCAALIFFALPTNALTVRTVGSVQKGTNGPIEVTVVFSEPVDVATGSQITNYTLGTGTITAATVVTGLPAADLIGVDGYTPPSGRAFDGMLVVLTATGVPTSGANSLTVRNIKDRGAPQTTITTATIPFTDSGYKWVETGMLGTSALPGHVVAINTNGFDLYSSGTTQWANYDEVTYAFKEVTGDFDYSARVEFQDVSSVWARAGIMLREDLDVGEPNPPDTVPGTFGRYVDMHANPVTSFNEAGPTPILRAGNNQFESHVRTGALLNASENGTDSSGGGTPLYPNAWLRIQRVGDTVTTYRGDDGTTWTEVVVRTFGSDPATDPSLPAKMYLGPGFSPESGNINPPEGKNRLFLAQVRFNKVETPILRSFTAFASGFRFLIDDAIVNQVNTNSIQTTFNGASVTPVITKNGTTTTISYVAATPLPPGSTNSVSLTFRDTGTPPTTQTYNRSFVVSQYAVLPGSIATTSVDLTKPGFSIYMHQIPVARTPGDGNSIANAEQELANGYIDPGTGLPYANSAPAGPNPDGTYSDPDIINWQIAGGPAGAGESFKDTDGYPNEPVPGINPSGTTDWFAAEITTFLNLPAGAYSMGVNSDDGFVVSAASGLGDVFGTVLGSFNGGRGSADTIFDFVVATNGFYPFRLTWWQGVGGGDLEWFVVDNATGKKILINDTNAAAVKAYRGGRSGARVESVLPVNNQLEVPTTSNIEATLVNDLTSVVNGSIQMTVDGATVAPVITLTGTTNRVVYNPSADFVPGSVHTVALTYNESTTPVRTRAVQWTFTATYFGPGGFAIEAEHFDYNGGQHIAAVDTMPYSGNEYDTLGAFHDIDYHANDTGPFTGGNPDGYNYRTGIPAQQAGPGRFVPMDSQTAPGLDVQRSGFEVTSNYKIGWTAGGEWYNYTRNIPSGIYTVVAALSHGDAPTSGTVMSGSLGRVTAGVGTSNQTVQALGTFSGPATGGWGNNALLPMKGPDGSNAVIKLSGTNTLRFTTGNGDFDWYMLVPVTGYPPRVLSASPASGSTVKRNSELNFTLSDLSTAVVPSSIRLILDGVDVTSSATITDTADGATVRYVPAPFTKETTHTYSLIFSDNGTPAVTQTNTGTFNVSVVGPGNFIIEAEDFNYGGGQFASAASVMPYTGGAYANTNAVHLVDYMNNDFGNESDLYRKGEIPNVNMDPTSDTDRGTFTVTSNYKIGWTDTGDWQNYTRNFPTNNYEIFAGLSHGNRGSNDIRATVQQVYGSTSISNQTVQTIGSFNAPGTGGWGSNTQVPLNDASGNRVVVHLEGIQTLRVTLDSGDFDYLTLAPTTLSANVPPRIISITRDGSGNITVTWVGGGVLEARTDVASGTWSQVDTASPYTAPASGTTMFFRVRR